ncbi:peptidylprolyl isomerase [Lichenicoccus sp.]|uniref:peptidylprolyl isomerase n=1 Tax=Lichenicoccus sp. TaxID=2781899 RepID=UPI003D096031
MRFPRLRPTTFPGLLVAGLVMLSVVPASAFAAHHARPAAPPQDTNEDAIVALVNGGIITRRDVDNRSRLFALSTGLPISPEVQARLRPQITRQLIDEKLRMQEIQSRHIVITATQIAAAIGGIEKRNNMQPNALRDHLMKDGVSLTTLIDQLRVQLGWTQVLREDLGMRARVSNSAITQRQAALKRETGQPEYDVSEIFIPVEDPKHDQSALAFAQTVIKQLRAGAPFPIVAAEFSQAQTALQGGALDWVQADALDPEVLDIVQQMPEGAISNPIRVAGGYDIVTLLGKRTIGNQIATLLDLRQAFVPFTSTLNPQAPTAQQQQALAHAQSISSHATSCDDIEKANAAAGNVRPANPGQVQLAALNPQMRDVLDKLKPGQATKPLVSTDGIAVIMVCARETKNLADRTPDQIADAILDERVEQVSRQADRDLHRRASISMRTAG